MYKRIAAMILVLIVQGCKQSGPWDGDNSQCPIKFNKGERVEFTHPNGHWGAGTVAKQFKDTCSVVVAGAGSKVFSPYLLQKMD